MTIFRGGIGRFSGGVRAAVFFLWIVILFFSQLGLHFAVHNNNSNKDASTSSGSHQSFTFHPPRKALSLDTASFHAPSSLSQFTVNEDDPDTIYEDDMRVVHTGHCSFSNGLDNDEKKGKTRERLVLMLLFLLYLLLL